ncbi:replication-associated recombination protein A [Haploplasma modicum]|uniref:replication-associated recombination protein A n=1 Tax=Haploplasma modicum TaxID=2150 RepID=UPI00214BCE3C|nr:replication-associated recombination protein A [Haploplasma modicum]MCR1808851.1 replication-associated recombination protein A [Haploplasma modicum]
MEPLASKMRPKSFDDILGQDHLVGENGIIRKMVMKNKPLSFVLYGPPGTGKTTIANIFSKEINMESFIFNASTDNKARLQDIIHTTNFNNIVLIVDEVHRMKSDIQDFLLPYLENGKVTMIGLTTTNPNHSVNWAIRSRVNIYELNPISDKDLKNLIFKALKYLDIEISIDDEAMDLLIRYANNEARSLLNLIDTATLYLEDGATLTKELIKSILGNPKFNLDKNQDNYYILLSGLQKSIRGSDVDASLHYLARLITLGDLESILRRLIVIAYEDIGLAQPAMGGKVMDAYHACKTIGFPEASIILSAVVIDMAVSPKSNTAYLAIDKALTRYNQTNASEVPNYIDNNLIKADPSIYHYPHDSAGSLNDQRYLPKKIESDIYYEPKDESKYEAALKQRLLEIDKIKGIRRVKEKK